MSETTTKVPVKTQDKPKSPAVPAVAGEWHPFANLRKEMDRLFEDFDRSLFRNPFTRSLFDVEPFWRREFSVAPIPASDIVEHDKDYQIAIELPGMDEGNVEVELSNGILSITGEKKEQKEEHKKNYHLSERYHGSFQRSFRIPEGVDTARIDAALRKGVLTVTLPKDGEAQKNAKHIPIKAG